MQKNISKLDLDLCLKQNKKTICITLRYILWKKVTALPNKLTLSDAGDTADAVISPWVSLSILASFVLLQPKYLMRSPHEYYLDSSADKIMLPGQPDCQNSSLVITVMACIAPLPSTQAFRNIYDAQPSKASDLDGLFKTDRGA